MKLIKAAQMISDTFEETLAYYHFPEEHWRRIRTNNRKRSSEALMKAAAE
jgi:transposase-like protein